MNILDLVNILLLIEKFTESRIIYTKERMQPTPIRTANITLLAGNDLREKRKKIVPLKDQLSKRNLEKMNQVSNWIYLLEKF